MHSLADARTDVVVSERASGSAPTRLSAEDPDPAESMFVKIKSFEGPLSLLLSLVRKHELSVYDIPIAFITQQFLNRFTSCKDLEDLTSFYQMATWLLHIKTKMLVPSLSTMEDEEEIEDPRQELVDVLIEFEKYKQLSLLLEKRQQDCRWMAVRSPEKTIHFEELPTPLWKDTQKFDLQAAFERVLNRQEESLVPQMVLSDETVTVEDKIMCLQDILSTRNSCTLDTIVGKNGGIISLVCSFLAALELIKRQLVIAFQHEWEGTIVLRKQEL